MFPSCELCLNLDIAAGDMKGVFLADKKYGREGKVIQQALEAVERQLEQIYCFKNVYIRHDTGHGTEHSQQIVKLVRRLNLGWTIKDMDAEWPEPVSAVSTYNIPDPDDFIFVGEYYRPEGDA